MNDEIFGRPWHGEYRIRRDEIGAAGRVKITCLFDYLQDAASHHATALGVSIEDLKEKNQAWVLRSMRLAIERLPGWGQTVRVETWPSGADRLTALRDYRIRDEAGCMVARADSVWLIIDRSSRKPQRLPREWATYPFSVDRAFPESARKPERLEIVETACPVQAASWDSDFNGHINHVRYLEWILGTPPKGLAPESCPMEITVQFVQEAVPGEALEVLSGPLEPVLCGRSNSVSPSRETPPVTTDEGCSACASPPLEGPTGLSSRHEIIDAATGAPLVVARAVWSAP